MMQATDFVYDGISLSSFGFVIGSLDGTSGVETVEAGAPLSFRTVSRRKGQKWSLVDTKYDSALEITFDIYRNPCLDESAGMVIPDGDFLQISKWLRRREYKELYFIDDTLSVQRYYKALFNVSKLMSDDTLVGLRLTAVTDKPFAFGERITLEHTFAAEGEWTIQDMSYIYGTITPNMTITCAASGDLVLNNTYTDSVMQIKNCTSGEVITVDGENLIILSDDNDHAMWDDFNYEFLRIGVAPGSSSNTITASIACSITLSYTPIIHDAP